LVCREREQSPPWRPSGYPESSVKTSIHG
jgi:hypothetical protein